MFSQTIRCREFAIAAAVTVMLIGSVATGHSQDVIGRSKSKWGTTEEDLLRSFPGGAIRLDKEETVKNPPGYAPVGINNFEIGRQIYRVRFVMDPSERRLMSVVLDLDEQNHPAAETSLQTWNKRSSSSTVRQYLRTTSANRIGGRVASYSRDYRIDAHVENAEDNN